MNYNLYQQFKIQALKTPHHLCLVDEHKQLTYQMAVNAIDRAANALLKKGIQCNDVVALYSPKRNEAILSFFALAKIGATTLTLDLAFPEKQITYALKDAKARLVIDGVGASLPSEFALITFEELFASKEACDFEPKEQTNAWLVYSSGTTGNPKGVLISHQAMLSSYFWRYQISDYDCKERVACNIYFFWEAFRPLFRGGTVFIIPDEILHDLPQLMAYLSQHQISEILFTPSFASLFLDCLKAEDIQNLSALKRIWLNGEVVGQGLVKKCLSRLPQIDFYNLYSISETHDVAALRLEKAHAEKDIVPLGKPFCEVAAFVLNEQGMRCAANEKGELYVGGNGLAEGYLAREELNQRLFIEKEVEGQAYRLFKTGDMAYFDKKGCLYILGRVDHVVKLRGYNVSLLAIEDVLKQALSLKEAVIAIEGESAISQVIVAYMQVQDKASFIKTYELEMQTGLSQKLQAYLSSFLPHYAIPTQFFLTDDMKLNRYSAKLDRKALLLDKGHQSLEERLSTLWAHVLNIASDVIEKDSDFFLLGANSLHAIQFVHLFNEHFEKKITITDMAHLSAFKAQLAYLKGEKTTACEEDALLSKDLSLTFNKACLSVNKERLTILITGASGYLGAHCLSALLKNSDAKLYCLLRAADEEKGYQRLVNAFKRYGLDADLLNARVSIVLGNLEESNLGLKAKHYQYLSQTADAILHAGALVNLFYPYQKMRHSVVLGTYEILKLALNKKNKHLLYVSSDAVFANVPCTYSEKFLHKKSVNKLNYGYAKAKFIAEALIKKASQTKGFTYDVLRLGNLSPALEQGIINSEDSNTLLLKAIDKLHLIPENLSLEFTPVDKIANLICHLLHHSSEKQIFNLSRNNGISGGEVNQLFQSNQLPIVDEAVWLNALKTLDPTLSSLWQLENLFSHKLYQLEKQNYYRLLQTYPELNLSLEPLSLKRNLKQLRQAHSEFKYV